MNGHRLEILTLAKSKKGDVSFVVLDVLSDTLKWDPFQGIRWADARCFTRVQDGLIRHSTLSNQIGLKIDGLMRKSTGIQPRFAVDANRRCFYRNSTMSIVMDFDKSTVLQDVTRVFPIRLENTLWQEYRGALTHCFVHTKPMTFVVDAVEVR